MTTPKAIYEELQNLMPDPKGPSSSGQIWSFCPCHPDGSKTGRRSLSLHPIYGLKCWAGCQWETVATELRNRQGPMPVRQVSRVDGEPVAVYRYKDVNGNVIAEHGRFEQSAGQKSFAWRTPGRTWKEGLNGIRQVDLPLYNADQIASSQGVIYFVEGEKASDACTIQGLMAVTLPQGASGSTPSPQQLAILEQRDVILWPDNDEAGAKLMTKVEALLRPIAKTVSYVDIPINLPHKGDAHDYFSMGGTVDGLTSTGSEIVVEHKTADNITVHVPSASGLIHFAFEDIEKKKHAMDTELTVSLNGATHEPYGLRINILSNSATDSLRRNLENLYGKELQWTQIINSAFRRVRESYTAIDYAIDTATIEQLDAQDLFLVNPLLPADSPTVLFGDGGSFKSYVAIALAIHVAIGRPWMGAATPCLPVIYLDYEDTPHNFAKRQRRLLQGLGIDGGMPHNSLFYWPGRGLPHAGHVEALKRKIQSTGACLLIIDSIAPAAGGKAEDSEVALAYFRSLAKLSITTLNLAHVTKGAGGGSPDHPFGSIFWHNMARRTWHASRVQELQLPELDLGFYCKKANDGARPKNINIHAVFNDPDGPVVLTETEIKEVPQLSALQSTQQRVWDVLIMPMTIRQITEELIDIDETTVHQSLRRHPKSFIRQEQEVSQENKNKGRPPQLWARRHNE